MRRMLLIVLAGCLCAAPAGAQLLIGPNMAVSVVMNDDEEDNLSSWLAEAEYQFSFDQDGSHWGAFTAMYNGSDYAGLGVAYYHEVGAVYPGVKLTGFQLGADQSDLIPKTTTFFGLELLLEAAIPGPDDTSMPVTAFAGLSKSIRGEKDLKMARFGLRTALEAFGG